ncbi:hypothetical protein [Mycolicibacterium palauense]|uniref:hypothetical protein n=1 Tax=Mycolicibacterium palauense TaxID=2034511 RepID=UPI000BFEB050|nr:hypothetical protein [Mycolicibacterium palauense]
MRSKWLTSAALAAVLTAGNLTAAVAHADPSGEPAPPAPTPTSAPAPAPGEAPPPGPAPGPPQIAENGSYVVGTDIMPGTYESAGPIEGGVCYWKRTNGDTIVDSAMTKKPQVVQIAADDTGFTTRDCQPWVPSSCTQNCGPPQGDALAILGQLGAFIATHPG